jgi:hypothetical protein
MRIPMIRTFSGLVKLHTFEDRFEYLKLPGSVGARTFGFDRYINQRFYTSRQWQHVRNEVIARDYGCDLSVVGREIHDKIYIHHMNPISVNDLYDGNLDILKVEFLITTSRNTHLAIHYGDRSKLKREFKERRPGDTRLW